MTDLNLSYSQVIDFFKLIEAIELDDYIYCVEKHYNEFSKITNNPNITAVEILELQLALLKYLNKIKSKSSNAGGGGETHCPFFRILQSIRFDFCKAVNISIIEFDNLEFTKAIDYLEEYLFYSRNNQDSNNSENVIRQQATDDYLF